MSAARAHPRVGGKNARALPGAVPHSGSSPRGRGKHLFTGRRDATRRLIPAWAGKTCLRVAHRPECGAHPRVGGENTKNEYQELGTQ